jgi:hypothetical protein
MQMRVVRKLFAAELFRRIQSSCKFPPPGALLLSSDEVWLRRRVSHGDRVIYHNTSSFAYVVNSLEIFRKVKRRSAAVYANFYPYANEPWMQSVNFDVFELQIGRFGAQFIKREMRAFTRSEVVAPPAARWQRGRNCIIHPQAPGMGSSQMDFVNISCTRTCFACPMFFYCTLRSS